MSMNKFLYSLTILFSICCTSCHIGDHPKNFDLDTLYKKTVRVFPSYDHENRKMTIGLDQECRLDDYSIYFESNYKRVYKLYPGDILSCYYKNEKMTELATVTLSPSTYKEFYSNTEIRNFFSKDMVLLRFAIIDKENNLHSREKQDQFTTPVYARYHNDFLGSDGKPYLMAVYNYKMER